MESELRGISHRPPECQEAAWSLDLGDKVLLEREPENAFDENAVKVIHPIYNLHLGYVAKHVAPHVADWLDRDIPLSVKVIGVNARGNPVIEISEDDSGPSS